MKIGTMVRYKQSDVLDELHNVNYKPVHKDKRKHRRDKQERLSFSYVKNDLMPHDSYIRHNGAIAQRHWEK